MNQHETIHFYLHIFLLLYLFLLHHYILQGKIDFSVCFTLFKYMS